MRWGPDSYSCPSGTDWKGLEWSRLGKGTYLFMGSRQALAWSKLLLVLMRNSLWWLTLLPLLSKGTLNFTLNWAALCQQQPLQTSCGRDNQTKIVADCPDSWWHGLEQTFCSHKPLRNLDDSRIISTLSREGALSPVKGLLRLQLGAEAVANPQHKYQWPVTGAPKLRCAPSGV